MFSYKVLVDFTRMKPLDRCLNILQLGTLYSYTSLDYNWAFPENVKTDGQCILLTSNGCWLTDYRRIIEPS